MSLSAGFLIYAALYRLTVLLIGALSIWLGFRLFVQSGEQGSGQDNRSSATVKAGGVGLTLSNILPGIYFALFGTVLIGLMLWQGPPQMSQKEVMESIQNYGIVTTQQEVLYRDPTPSLDGNTDIKREWDRLRADMILAEAAGPLSNIARIYQRKNRIGDAVAMAKLAALYGEGAERAEHFDLLVELLRANGEEKAAEKAEQTALTIRRNR